MDWKALRTAPAESLKLRLRLMLLCLPFLLVAAVARCIWGTTAGERVALVSVLLLSLGPIAWRFWTVSRGRRATDA